MKFYCKKIRKRAITLIEMMIVMFLIAMITAVIAFNYTGSLEEGKAFKTKNGMDKIRTILDLHLAVHPEDASGIDAGWQKIVEQSQLIKGSADLIKDGWGSPYQVTTTHEGDIEIRSEKYEEYQKKKGKGSLFNQ